MTLLPIKALPFEYAGSITQDINMHILGRGKPWYHPESLLILQDVIRRVRRRKPDIIHWQLGYAGLPDLVLMPFFRKYPIVTTFHDVTIHLGEEHWAINSIRRYIRKSSDQIMVHGEKLKETMIEKYHFFSEKVHTIPFGEHEVAPFKQYERVDLEEDGNLILFFGRIFEYKGLEYLIKAEPLITKAVPEAKIIIAGTGEDFKKYEKLMGSRKDNFIIYNYHVSHREGAELFQRCSIVVLPYIEGSQSGVIPAAYGFYKPVVATGVGSIPEVVDDGKTGFIVPPRDSQALAKAVIKLLKDNKLRREMGANAYMKLKEDFSWDKIAEKTVQVYKKALKHQVAYSPIT